MKCKEWNLRDNKFTVHFGDEKAMKTKHITWKLLSKIAQYCRISQMLPCLVKFLWRQSNYLNYSSRRLLCNALIQPHFDYGYTLWCPVLSKTLETKLQIAQNKCIRVRLALPPCIYISPSHLRKINWLSVEHRVELFTSITIFKYGNGIVPS